MKRFNKKSKIIIILGPPGSGKGTQAELLAEKLNLYHIETSKILEANIMKAKKDEYAVVKGKKYYFSDEKRKWETGELVSDELVTFWMKKGIKNLARQKQNLILSGYPRTLHEVNESLPLLKKLYGRENIKIIQLKLSPTQSIWRNSNRRICELMRHPILFTKETAKLKYCPLDGSKLVKRERLDKPETIKVRLKEYTKKTYPLIKVFKKQGLKVKQINGEQSVADVFQDTLKAIK